MKHLLLIAVLGLATALFASSLATRVSDGAGMLSAPKVAALNETLQGRHVWVETFGAPPEGGLQAYAEKRVAELTGPTEEGFLIALSTSPRAWQIRMHPEARVPGHLTEVIGNTMGSAFRKGDVYEGLLNAANQLEGLLNPRPIARPELDYAMVQEPAKGQLARQALIEREAREREDATREWHLWLGLIAFVAVALLGGLIWARWRDAVAEREEWERRERRQRADEAAAKKQREKAQAEIEAARSDPAKVRAARTAFNEYTTSQRDRICRSHSSSPYYSSSASMDPWLFYWLAFSHGHCNHDGSAIASMTPSSYTPSSSYTPTSSSSSSSDDSHRRSSSSESTYSSPSYDSGSSSSFDSGSSSSDSGSGGSW